MGMSPHGKIEVVSLSPEEEKCELPSPFGFDKNQTLGSDYIIGNLDGEIHLYDGNFGMHKLSKDGHKWSLVANLNKTLKHFGMYFPINCVLKMEKSCNILGIQIHSSEIGCLCLMKCSSNRFTICHTKNLVVCFCFSVPKLMNALVYVDID